MKQVNKKQVNLCDTLPASLLGHLLAGKGVVRAGEGTITTG